MSGASPVQPPVVVACQSCAPQCDSHKPSRARCIYMMQFDRWLCAFCLPSVINGAH